jgi:hypothetical protein
MQVPPTVRDAAQVIANGGTLTDTQFEELQKFFRECKAESFSGPFINDAIVRMNAALERQSSRDAVWVKKHLGKILNEIAMHENIA